MRLTSAGPAANQTTGYVLMPATQQARSDTRTEGPGQLRAHASFED